jgi:hypothetical protein
MLGIGGKEKSLKKRKIVENYFKEHEFLRI